MSFKSEKQRKFLWENKPKVAVKFATHSTLTEAIKKVKGGKR